MKKFLWSLAAFGMFLISCFNWRWPKIGLSRWRMSRAWLSMKTTRREDMVPLDSLIDDLEENRRDR